MYNELTKPIQIQIIEDDPITADSLATILTELGYTIKTISTTVESAVQFLNKEVVDIALVDIHLHGTNSGINIGALLHNQYQIPYIFMTGISDRQTISDAIKSNPAAYLIKPASPATIFATIQTALQNFSFKENPEPNKSNNSGYFFIKFRNRLRRIDWKEVVLLTSSDNYTILTLLDGYNFPIRSTLKMTKQFLIPKHLCSQFMQVNRKQIVQLPYITAIANNEVITPLKPIVATGKFIEDLKSKVRIIG